jgi:hypothetical protein
MTNKKRMLQPFSILILILISLMAYATPNEQLCTTAGGQIEGRGCLCPTGEFVDPERSKCISLQIQEGGGKAGYVGSDLEDCVVKLPPQHLKSETLHIPKAKFCENPKTFLCNPSFNPYINKVDLSIRKLDRIKYEAEDDPLIQQFILKNLSDGKNYISGKCTDLENEKWIECQKMIEKLISSRVYTPARKDTTQKLYEKAKTATLGFLDKQKKVIESSGDDGQDEKIAVLEEMRKKILRTKLKFGPPVSDPISKFNASNEPPENWERIFDNSFSIHLEGVVVLADHAPESLYFILLHELAHSIGYLDFSESNLDDPFKNQVACLKDEKSINAKENDYNCFLGLSRLAESFHKPDLLKESKILASFTKKHHYLAPALPDDIFFKNCQVGQVEEAFADWIATESYAGSEKTKLTPKLPFTGMRSDKNIDVDVKNLEEIVPDQLLDYLAFLCSDFNSNDNDKPNPLQASHPASSNRLDLMFANPIINVSIGCSPKKITRYDPYATRPQPSGVHLYCGQERIGSKKGKK